ncbi:MAG: hypothetical protein QXL86_02350 [Candidatus Aenigmatarchaeota archaeon]
MESCLKVRIKSKNPSLIENVTKILKKYEIEISKDYDIIISIGGDGTYIQTYKELWKPILPVRTEDSLGYIADIGIEKLDETCEKLSKKLYHIERRPMLDVYKIETYKCKRNKIGSAINDVTISTIPTQAMRFSLLTNGKNLFNMKRIMGDGVIVATSVGSTAYNRSVGGYIISSNLNQFVVTLINPVYMPRCEEKSKILEENTKITFSLEEPEKVFLVIDNEYYEIDKYSSIFIEKSSKTFDLVKIEGMEESFEEKERRREEWFKKFVNIKKISDDKYSNISQL